LRVADTFVTRLSAGEGRRLYEALGRDRFAFRPADHAHWSARGEETTATWYRSGKLVVQGKGLAAFLARYLPGADLPAPAPSPEAPSGPTVGSDESGKGDYFGPLVVAAALVGPGDEEGLRRLGVQDSKALGDERILRMEGALARLPHAMRVLEPEDYNRRWAESRNVNVLLGRLHAEAIEEVVAGRPDAVGIVVDRFGDDAHVRRHLARAASLPFDMRVRGESHLAVAAASCLARAAFLRSFERLRGLSDAFLPMGASDPRILGAARALWREGGEAWLGRFAKLHFRTTERVRGA
jgi:ribonuclease HIII